MSNSANTSSYESHLLVAAFLIFIARSSGSIEPEETARMLGLLQSHYRLHGAESLELLTRAISEFAAKPELGDMLAELGRRLSDAEKEDVAVMALKVIAADGRRKVAEMEKFNEAVEAVGASPEIVHRAFDRYFAETMPGDS
jgi:uncharacterized tellurite resistance protein B-like protein